jgi:hypothetical protein
MTIPLSQLDTWSAQGSITQSKNTYASVKAALEDTNAQYKNRNFKVFLQGSYGNDTNIYAESDVDVVIRYDGAFFHDIKTRPLDEQAAFHQAFTNAGGYGYGEFKEHVTNILVSKLGEAVKPGKKAIRIEGNGNRRNADVIVAFEYRRYYKFKSVFDESHVTGMCFFGAGGKQIANYPISHSENLTKKHQDTNGKFKPMVRIFKNARSKLVADGLIPKGSAPSYYVEGLLYNVPNDRFTGNYQEVFLKILQWLYETNSRIDFVCANEQYYLLRDDCETCWACDDGKKFVNAVIGLWNNW